MKPPAKQRVTAFIHPDLVKRAKVRGALENLTISEIVERALEAYAPKPAAIKSLIADTGIRSK